MGHHIELINKSLQRKLGLDDKRSVLGELADHDYKVRVGVDGSLSGTLSLKDKSGKVVMFDISGERDNHSTDHMVDVCTLSVVVKTKLDEFGLSDSLMRTKELPQVSHNSALMGLAELLENDIRFVYGDQIYCANLTEFEGTFCSINYGKEFTAKLLEVFREAERSDNAIVREISHKEIVYRDTGAHSSSMSSNTSWVSVSVACINQRTHESPSRHVYAIQNITKQKEQEEQMSEKVIHLGECVQERTQELLEMEERFQSIMSSSADKIFIIDPLGVINHLVESEDAKAMIDSKLSNWISTSTLLQGKIEHVLSTRRSEKCEAKFVNKDVYYNVNLVYQSPTSVVVILTNITEVKQLSHELVSAIHAKTRFLANMSHEIRTPISGILGMGRLLDETGLNADQSEYVTTIRNCGESLLSVINDIMDYTKLEASDMTLEKVEMSLVNCIEEAIYIALPAVENKGIDIVLDIGKVPNKIVGDPVRIRQVTINLLNNAAKFTEKGFILISLAGQPLSADPKSEWEFSVTVKDTGCGVPLESQDKLFQLFSQLDMSPTKRFGGTGVGLALTKRLVGLMGGKVWMTSTGVVGEGSTFSFSFRGNVIPCVPAEILPKSVRDFSPSTQVIIVDKSEVFRENLHDRLKLKGFNNICILDAFDETRLKEIVEASMPMKTLLFCEYDESYNQAVLELQAKTAPAFTLVFMGATRPQGKKDNYFLRKPIKEELLKGVILEIIQLWLSKSSKRRHSVSEIPSSRFIRPAMRQPVLPSLEEETPPLKILVAEDNPMNQKVLIRSLSTMGHKEVVLAEDGKQAFDALTDTIPDLILMDIQMPVYDGLTCTKMIREKYGPWPFIAAMTANTFPEDKENALSAGMNAFLTKPLRVDQLRAVVQECITTKASLFGRRGIVDGTRNSITRTVSDSTFRSNPTAFYYHSAPQSRSSNSIALKPNPPNNCNKPPTINVNNNTNNNNNHKGSSGVISPHHQYRSFTKIVNDLKASSESGSQPLKNSMDFYTKIKCPNLDNYTMNPTKTADSSESEDSDAVNSEELVEGEEDDENLVEGEDEDPADGNGPARDCLGNSGSTANGNSNSGSDTDCGDSEQ